MSESRITYIPCASGHNVFTDCMVQQYGDLIRRYGHAQMDFTAADAKTMAYHILDMLDNPYREIRPLAAIPEGAPSSGEPNARRNPPHRTPPDELRNSLEHT